MIAGVDLDRLAEVCLSGLSIVKFLLLGRKLLCAAHTLPSFKMKYLHKLSGTHLQGRFVSSPLFINLSIICLCQYQLMDIYFILWIIMQYLLYFVAQISRQWLFHLFSNILFWISSLPGER